jgi:hypothetical protein
MGLARVASDANVPAGVRFQIQVRAVNRWYGPPATVTWTQP